ncbi:hypothetical protein AB8S08_05240 [Pseudidiomarina sp. PP-1MA]|uniref:Uncharacterized protein n=1 Tax=Pseudidiomarina sp. PP-1MA TaxID=3237706 RepID=A0AB39X9R4_9GAMM
MKFNYSAVCWFRNKTHHAPQVAAVHGRCRVQQGVLTQRVYWVVVK